MLGKKNINYVVINLDDVYEVVEKKNAFICKIKPWHVAIPTMSSIIEREKIPKEMFTDSLIKEWLKQKLYEIGSKYRFWCEYEMPSMRVNEYKGKS